MGRIQSSVSPTSVAGIRAVADAATPMFSDLKLQGSPITEKGIIEGLLSTEQPKMMVGEVESAQGNKVALVYNGRPIIEAYRIGNIRTKADDGTVAVSAIMEPGRPVDQGEGDAEIVNGKLVGTKAEIWLIRPDGSKKQVSPDNVHATRPVLSRSGNLLAYSGATINENGFPGTEELYLMNLTTGETVAYTPEIDHPEYVDVAGFSWDESGRILNVLVSWGEATTNMRVEQLRF